MSSIPEQIKTIVFDLDDTLYDCSRTIVSENRKHASKIISKAINCSETEALGLQLRLEEKHGPEVDISRKIANLHNLPNELYVEISNAINTIKVKEISLFPDVINSINRLKKIGYKLILVTTGDRDIQEWKIKVLGLEGAFDEIRINNLPGEKGEIFKELLNRLDLRPEQVLCVGDKIKDEIVAGKDLGMFTVLMKHGRHYDFYKSNSNDIVPDLYINNISDLLGE
jgi:putative hydrolase of the HAD superfamily